MLGKILLVIILLPILYFTLIAGAGLLAGVLGVAAYYCIKYLLVGLVVLAIILLARECRRTKD